MRAKLLAIVAGSAIALTAAAPANATAWNGDTFEFGYGSEWELNNFYLEDVYLQTSSTVFGQPSSEDIYTDIWDGGLVMSVTSPTLGLDNVEYSCDNDADIDITTDADDLLIDCTTDWSETSDDDVAIRGHIRFLGADGDLVRFTLDITNNSGADITDLSVETSTDFGSSGEIWGYQNQNDATLAVPAGESDSNADVLAENGTNWLVNIDYADPSGSLAWGNNTGSVNVDLTTSDGDTFYTTTDTFTVPVGKTVTLAYFTGWNPEFLNGLSYTDGGRFATDADAEASADDMVAQSAEFDSFEGRLVRGLEDANVINWGPAPAEGLAETGADISSLWAGLGLLVAGVGVVAIRRRVRA